MSGVSIGLIFNNEGLFKKANSAASRYNDAKERELGFLQNTEKDLSKYNVIYGEGTLNPTETIPLTPTSEPTPDLPEAGEEVPEAGWTVDVAKGIVARDGLKAHMGEKVEYNPIGGGTWRIFYYDTEDDGNGKGYFGDELNTLYLKKDYDSNATPLSNYVNYMPEDNGARMKKMNPKWARSTEHNLIDQPNEHCVAWLCDEKQWEKYKLDGIANYAVGSPSVEMYMKAFGVYKEKDGDPDRNSTVLVCKIDDTS